jgi:GntR family transcriptional repressor for pyruvate dehydrogenase complex
VANPSLERPRRAARPVVPGTQLKASESIARRVVETIVDRGLTPGDMLPREADMLREYGVSRETLREALRLLEVQGLITLRRGPGGGPVVAAAQSVNLGRVSTLYFQMAGATYNELFEAWVLGEGTLAERAARNPDNALRVTTMAPYIEAVDDDDHESVASFMLTHTGFHDAVGALGNNRVLDLTLASFGKIVSYQAGVIEDPRLLRTQLYEDHQKVARAISAGHNRAARQLMEEHIGAVLEYFRGHFHGRLDDAVEWL